MKIGTPDFGFPRARARVRAFLYIEELFIGGRLGNHLRRFRREWIGLRSRSLAARIRRFLYPKTPKFDIIEDNVSKAFSYLSNSGDPWGAPSDDLGLPSDAIRSCATCFYGERGGFELCVACSAFLALCSLAGAQVAHGVPWAAELAWAFAVATMLLRWDLGGAWCAGAL